MRMTYDNSVDFILNELAVPEPEKRATRDKARKRLTYALGKGHLPRIDVRTLDVDRDELIYWARKKWKGHFKMPIEVLDHLSDTMNLSAKSNALQLPNDLQKCHALILDAESRIRFLGIMVSSQAATIQRLKPLADQYERNCEKSQASARKPRHRRG